MHFAPKLSFVVRARVFYFSTVSRGGDRQRPLSICKKNIEKDLIIRGDHRRGFFYAEVTGIERANADVDGMRRRCDGGGVLIKLVGKFGQ